MKMLEEIIPSDHNILHNLVPKFDGINVSDLCILLVVDIYRPLREGSYVSSRVMEFMAPMINWIKMLNDGWGIQSACDCNTGGRYSYVD